MTHFAQSVLAVVRRIPKGKVLTYREVAKRVGSPRAFRAVGSVLRGNFDPRIPCHRVVRSDGSPGGYNRGGIPAKRKLLVVEGAFPDRPL